ncbi:MAG TPA: isoprenylcysteine carboxylmethyltransferase family protein [Caldilinea sp.]|nr:isoprenylcysteine carboxylmethyltransferase family protein [Caldilinea sp.]
MTVDAAHKSKWMIAEVVFGVPFLLGVALQFAVPLAAPPGALRWILALTGGVLVIAAVALVAAARRELARFRQPTDPGHPTSKLVTTGVFAISRNPLYLGGALLLLGIALAFNLLWAVLAVALATIICRYALIAPEERYLAARFGTAYAEYCASVRRWLGRR